MVDRKQEILEVAEELLLVKGFCGFSYQDLSRRLGITKASIHHHFPSKEDLGIALCDRFEERFSEIAGEAEAKGAGPRALIDAVIDHGAVLAEAGDRCCPGGVLQAEYESLPERLRGRVDALFARMHANLTEAFEAARSTGQLRFEGPASDQAWLFMSTQHGAVLSARVHGAEVYHAVARQLRGSLSP